MARNAKKRQLLSENKFCIYCGGSEPSTTWDHMPNKGMFPKDRPGGLEFPSCEKCNQSSKWFEDIASFIGSVQWVASDGSVTQHFEAKLKHLMSNHPDVLEELSPTPSQSRRIREIADLNGVADVSSITCMPKSTQSSISAQTLTIFPTAVRNSSDKGLSSNWR